MKNKQVTPAIARFLSTDTVRLLKALHESVTAGDGLMLVCGPQGSGKSGLLEHFVQNAAQHWRICRASAMANPEGMMLLARIASCFELRLFGKDGKEPVEQLRGRLVEVERAMMIPVIAIDDAERLDDETVAWLVRLLTPAQPPLGGPRIVLFGDHTMPDRLAGIPVNVQRLDILPLDLPGIGDYLRHQLHLTGHSGSFPFSQRQLRRIKKESGGWPGRINSVAQEILAIEGPAGRGHLLSALIVVALFLLGLIILYFVMVPDTPPVGATVARQRAPHVVPASDPMAEAAPPIVVPDARPQDGAAQPSVSDPEAATEFAAPAESIAKQRVPAIEQSGMPPQPGAVLASPAVLDGRIEGGGWVAQQSRTNYTLQVMVGSAPGAVIELAQGARDVAAPMAVASFTQEGRQLYLLLYGSYATRGEAEDAAVQVEANFRMRPWIRSFATLPALSDVVVPSAAASAPPPAASSEAIAGAAWLWSRNPTHYTIQLLGDGRRGTLHDFVERHHPAGPLAMVRVVRGGAEWHLLLAGDYASAAEAAAAIAALPSEMRGGAPWPRPFSAVQDQMAASAR